MSPSGHHVPKNRLHDVQTHMILVPSNGWMEEKCRAVTFFKAVASKSIGSTEWPTPCLVRITRSGYVGFFNDQNKTKPPSPQG